MRSATNDITKDKLISRPGTKAYRDGYDSITFGTLREKMSREAQAEAKLRAEGMISEMDNIQGSSEAT